MPLPPIDIPYLVEKGYERRKCVETSLWYWSSDPDRVTCGDTHLDEYTFIGEPLISGFKERGLELKNNMRERFLRYCLVPCISITNEVYIFLIFNCINQRTNQ